MEKGLDRSINNPRSLTYLVLSLQVNIGQEVLSRNKTVIGQTSD